MASDANIQLYNPQCQGLSLAVLHPSKTQLPGPQGGWRLEPAQLRCIEKELAMIANHPPPPVCSLASGLGFRRCGLAPLTSKLSIAVLRGYSWAAWCGQQPEPQTSAGLRRTLGLAAPTPTGLILVTGKPASLFGI